MDRYEQLRDILARLQELSEEARSLISEEWPDELDNLDAYGALDFGSSSNPYDTTFSIVANFLLTQENENDSNS